MRIHFPLLSWPSTAVLIGAVILGADVSLYDLTVSLSYTDAEAAVGIHPTFLCLVGRDVIDSAALTYGNLIICRENLIEPYRSDTIAHEARHLEQWHALGPWVWLAQYILPLEPPAAEMPSLRVELASMWNPPEQWSWRWNFIELRTRQPHAQNPSSQISVW